MHNVNFYTLMYVADNESRRFSGKQYSGESKLDIFVKGACVLDKSLKINGASGLCLLTNNTDAIQASLARVGYTGLMVKTIDFDLNVPMGCKFYTAHYKIDVFRYLGTRPDDEYSILLDSDVVSIYPFGGDFHSIIQAGLPMVYNLSGYGGERRLKDVAKIVDDVDWMAWAGGEFIGGCNEFFRALYQDICSFKESYWENIDNDLFHVGDEMLTSIALSHLRGRFIPVDAGANGFIHRYWSVFDELEYTDRNTALVHFPGDKEYFANVNLNAESVENLMKNYRTYRLKCRIKGLVKKILDKQWYTKL